MSISLPKLINSSSKGLNSFIAFNSFVALAFAFGSKSLCEFLLVGLIISCKSSINISLPVLVSLDVFLAFKYSS